MVYGTGGGVVCDGGGKVVFSTSVSVSVETPGNWVVTIIGGGVVVKVGGVVL